MRKVLSKYSLEIKVLPIFLVLYLFTRLFRIMSLPLFTDEAIYTRWSQIARHDAAWRMISLTDGKQPSFIWAQMILIRFLDDPLLAGRLVSVGAGLVVTVGMYFLARELFKNKIVGLIAAFLYILFPMGLVYDRMALYDSMVAAFCVWTLYFHILLFKKKRLDIALIHGMILGGAVLTKTSGFLFIYMTPFLVLLTDFRKKLWKKELLRWASLVFVSVIFAYGYYSILRLSPFFHIIGDKNAVFVYPIAEWLEHPTRFVMGNLSGMGDWAFGYLSLPIIVFALFSFFIDRKKYIGEKILLFLWFFFPFLGLATFGKVLYPRFIFFMLLPIIILASYGLYLTLLRFQKSWMRMLIIFIAIAVFVRADFYILTNFATAPIPKADLYQYINGWPAGGGVNEIIRILSDEAKKGKIYVATEGTFGSLPTYAVEIYLWDNNNVEKEGIYPLPKTLPNNLFKKAMEMPTYFILNESYSPPALWPLEEIGVFQKGVGDHYMRLYKVSPRNET